MKVFYCSTCFECCYIHPQKLVNVCGCAALFRCVLVYWCGSAGIGWYPNAGWCTNGLCVWGGVEWTGLSRPLHSTPHTQTISAPTCIRIPPYSSRTAPIHQYTPKQSSTPTYINQLLRMNVTAFETC